MVAQPKFGDFQRRVDFEPGYNNLHRAGYGVHGMQMRFLLIGPEGATQFLFNTGWVPLGVVNEHLKDEHGEWPWGTVKHSHAEISNHFPSGVDLGYHWKTPIYGSMEQFNCDLLDSEGKCFYDGSGSHADPVLRDFISKGEDGVWRWLEKRYQWCLDAEVEDL